jgi:phosphopantetheinyl transferase (holo-ACP synthase)
MVALPHVGNDIVDLAAPGNLGKSGDGRFCGRVFTAEERALIAGAVRPDALLWALWAAKEAAYKAVSRGDPAVCSIPRQYCVVLETGNTINRDSAPIYHREIGALSLFILAGKVITPRGELALRVALTADWVHALAAESAAAIERLCRCVKGLCGAGDPSAFVRRGLLREIARFLGCAAGDLSVVKDPGGPGAPGVLFHGRPLAAEVSLSHDGRFAAFAFDPSTLTVPADSTG